MSKIQHSSNGWQQSTGAVSPFGPFNTEFHHNPFQSFHDDAYRNIHSSFDHNRNWLSSGFGPPLIFPQMPPFPAFLDHAGGTKVNWKELDAAYVMEVDMPVGMDKLQLEIENNSVIRIFGEKKKEKRDGGCRVSSYSKFEKKFKVPEDGDVGKIEVKTGNGGGMVVTVPKRRNRRQLHGEGGSRSIGISG